MKKKLKRITFDQYIFDWLKPQYEDEVKTRCGVSFHIEDIPNRNERQVPYDIWKALLIHHLNYLYN